MLNEKFITNLKKACMEGWSQATSSEPDLWKKENAALGQCAVTALIVQEFLGGWIVRAPYADRGVSGTHYFNVLEDGRRIDFTESQFTKDVFFDLPPDTTNGQLIKQSIEFALSRAGGIEVDDEQDIVRSYLLANNGTAGRYETLRLRALDYMNACPFPPAASKTPRREEGCALRL